MSGVDVLLPFEPLFIVDKSWRIQNTFKVTNKVNLDIRVSDLLKVSKAARSAVSLHGTVGRTAPPPSFPNTSRGRSSFLFVAANEPGGRQDKNAKRAVRSNARKYINGSQKGPARVRSTVRAQLEPTHKSLERKDGTSEAESSSRSELSLLPVVPNTSSSIYGSGHVSVPAGLEDYLHYYRHVIAANNYPLEKYMLFDINRIRSICFPIALADRLFLQTILMVSALHHARVTGTSISRHIHTLTHRVLTELRARIAHNDVSDATLLSVSCIAQLENASGHHSQWYIHDVGMNEMLRLRGGIRAIDTSIRWKLYGADMVGAVDYMKKPMLPHPDFGANVNILTSKADMASDSEISLTSLPEGGAGNALQYVYSLMHRLVQTIRGAIREKQPLSTSLYDDSCMYIKHDLLDIEPENAVGESWKIAGLIFMNSFTKSRPFYGPNCTFLSSKLRICFNEALKFLGQNNEGLWLAFMGGFVSFETSDHDWFIQQLQHTVQACGYTTWDETKTVLEKGLWLGVVHDEAGSRLWKEVFAIRPSTWRLG